MKVSFVDEGSGRVLHVDDGLERSDFSVGDSISIVSDQQFGREIEIVGIIVAVGLNIRSSGSEPAERFLVVTVRTA